MKRQSILLNHTWITIRDLFWGLVGAYAPVLGSGSVQFRNTSKRIVQATLQVRRDISAWIAVLVAA